MTTNEFYLSLFFPSPCFVCTRCMSLKLVASVWSYGFHFTNLDLAKNDKATCAGSCPEVGDSACSPPLSLLTQMSSLLSPAL